MKLHFSFSKTHLCSVQPFCSTAKVAASRLLHLPRTALMPLGAEASTMSGSFNLLLNSFVACRNCWCSEPSVANTKMTAHLKHKLLAVMNIASSVSVKIEIPAHLLEIILIRETNTRVRKPRKDDKDRCFLYLAQNPHFLLKCFIICVLAVNQGRKTWLQGNLQEVWVRKVHFKQRHGANIICKRCC